MKTIKMLCLLLVSSVILSTSSFAGDGVKPDAKRTFRNERSCVHTKGCPMNKVVKQHVKHSPKYHIEKHK
jgi:hypothetical protein